MPLPVVGWRAWYAGGQVFSSTETEWVELPEARMVGAVVYYPGRWRDIVHGGDWFYLEDGRPTASATADKPGEWVDPPDVPEAELKRGVSVGDQEWERIYEAMWEADSWL